MWHRVRLVGSGAVQYIGVIIQVVFMPKHVGHLGRLCELPATQPRDV